MGNIIEKETDGVKYLLLEDHDFSWLHSLGKVFAVFDQNDSGNISFGVEKDGAKLFVKYAGAKTVNANIPSAEAVKRIKKSVPVYRDLRHPVLLNLTDTIEIESGYAIMTEWFGGACLNAHWDFDKYAKYTHPKSPTYMYKALPYEKKIESLRDIMAFHINAAEKGYLPVDFYDGSIMYDFAGGITKVCDIEFYHKGSFTNDMGRMWGSSRFMSPEEFEKGAVIDERTSVYTMGALMFFTFGDEREKVFSKWTAGKELFAVAQQAVSARKSDRFADLPGMMRAVEEVI